VYAIPQEKVARGEGKVTFKDVPEYDAPAFITDRKLLSIQPVLGE